MFPASERSRNPSPREPKENEPEHLQVGQRDREQLCDSSAGNRQRHSHNPRIAWPCRCKYHNDLHPCQHGWRFRRSQSIRSVVNLQRHIYYVQAHTLEQQETGDYKSDFLNRHDVTPFGLRWNTVGEQQFGAGSVAIVSDDGWVNVRQWNAINLLELTAPPRYPQKQLILHLALLSIFESQPS